MFRRQRDEPWRAKASELLVPTTPDPGISETRGAIDHGPKSKGLLSIFRRQRDEPWRAKASELLVPTTPDPGISETRGAIDHGPKQRWWKRR